MLIFRQLFEHTSSTFTYILGCSITKQAIIIDPVLETVVRDATLLKELELAPKYALNTHVHADHVTGTRALKQYFNNGELKSVISKKSNGLADIKLENGDRLKWGNGMELVARATPGHTEGCMTFVLHKMRMAFTGDALLIRGCGRTDFQGGDAKMLYKNVHKEILSLPSDFLLYPAHDYNGHMCTTVEEELKFNPRLTKSEMEFVEIMKNLKLKKPAQIDKAVPANLMDGVEKLMDEELRRKICINTLD